VLYHFHILTPVIVLANLAVLLPLFLLVGAGFLALPLVWIGFPWPVLLRSPLGALCAVLVTAVDALSRIPHAYVYLPSPPLWTLGLYYGGLLLWARSETRRIRTAGAAGVLGAFGLFLLPRAVPPRGGAWTLTMLDVGQGSSVVFESPDGRVAVVDAGSKRAGNAGEAVIAPFLWHRGYASIDLLVLSHADSDHTNGALSLADRFRIGQVVVNRHFETSRQGRRLVRALRARGISVLRVGGAQSLLTFAPARLDVLDPRDPSAEGLLSKNDSSLVLRIVPPGGRRVLLTGDLQERGLRALFAAHPEIAPDVVQVPHHGSPAPRGNRRLAESRPIALVSSGARFEVGATLDMYRRRGCRTYWTARNGSVSITFVEDGSLRVGTCAFRDVDER
jgi:competence protein ComEC